MLDLKYSRKQIKTTIRLLVDRHQFNKSYKKFQSFTMVPHDDFITNLSLCKRTKEIDGAVVECGVWRGGMMAAMANLLGPQKKYYLFDSFEGLPDAKPIDGIAAEHWQANKKSPGYFDNCKAEIDYAQKAMQLSNTTKEKVVFIKGWFNETLVERNFNDKISLLRLDADWYDSTMTCLEFFFPKIVPGGMIIIDDYHTWEGCTKALHDYLSKNARPEAIQQFENKIAYIIKK